MATTFELCRYYSISLIPRELEFMFNEFSMKVTVRGNRGRDLIFRFFVFARGLVGCAGEIILFLNKYVYLYPVTKFIIEKRF